MCNANYGTLALCITDTEKGSSPTLHLFAWKPYQKGSGDPYLSLRRIEQNPPDTASTLSEWNGMKIWQIATIPPTYWKCN